MSDASLIQRLKISERVERILADPEGMSHRRNAAIIEALLEDEAEAPTVGSVTWQAAVKAFEKVEAEGDPAKKEKLLAALGQVLRAGFNLVAARDRRVELLAEQAKHLAAEERRRANDESSLSAQEAVALAKAVLAIVIRYLPDPGSQRQAAREIGALISSPGGASALGQGED